MRRSVFYFVKRSSDFRVNIETVFSKKNALVILDIDNTVMFPNGYKKTQFGKLGYGNDFWFTAIANQIKTQPHSAELWTLFIAHYYAIQPHLQYQLTDPIIPESLFALQEKNIPIIALTARGKAIEAVTLRHLQKMNIHFTDAIFCNGAPKGVCLESFFKTESGKQFANVDHVLFMDDSHAHCDHVEKTLEKYGFSHSVFHYSHVEDNVAKQTEDELKQDALLLEQETGLYFRF